jgi:cell wall-associated NlpC family hydrolase
VGHASHTRSVRAAKNGFAIGLALLAAALLTGDLSASPARDLKAKHAQARQVLAQIDALDNQLGRTVEGWNGARYTLGKSRQQLASELVLLRIAKQQRHRAIVQMNARLVGLYEDPAPQTTIGILLGSTSVNDMITQFDAANVVSDADHRLALETSAARERYATAVRRTRSITNRQQHAVARLGSKRQQIDQMLAQRRQLLSTVQTQITTLKADEARHQRILAAQARVRLARQKAELRRAAAARAQAAAASRAAAATPTPPRPGAPAETPAATSTLEATTTTIAPAATIPAPPVAVPVPLPAAGGGHPEAATIAMRYLGVPYLWGGASPAGFDCSGLVLYVYAQLGISLPHFAAAQYGSGTPVARDQLQPGDLVFFDGLNHVGIYIGGDEMIHAPHTGDVVKISPMSDFGNAYVGARRL